MVAALGMNTEEALHLIEGSSPDKELENREAVEVVNEMLETLTPKEAKVLRMRFGIGCNEHTLEEAGQVLAVTKERIRQIEAKAMRKMQHPSRMVELWNVKQ
jgi:RNA polymerase primary sigma factor